MNDQKLRDLIKNDLSVFLREYDTENRGNRLSRALIAGTGGYLEDFIFELVKRIQNANNRKSKSK